MVIQTISNTGKTFVTRGGKEEGLTDGVRGTFTVENAAITAEAVEVTRGFVVWKVIEEDAYTPFKKGEIVTFNFSTEAIWLNPPRREEQISGLTLKEKIGEEKRQLVQNITMKGFRGFGISESVSGVGAENDGSRAMVQGEIIYGREIRKGLNLEFGIRGEQEANEQSTFTITSSRYFATIGGSYFLYELPIATVITPYIGASLGYGVSGTKVAGSQLRGNGYILPNLRIGIDTFISDRWAFQGEFGFESLTLREQFEDDGTEQTTTQSNIKLGVGLRYMY